MPLNDDDLETNYSVQDETDVETVDEDRVAQEATDEHAIHQYKNFIGNSESASVEWEGQTNTNCEFSTVYLQIYNQNETTWETLDSESSEVADTDFPLSGNIPDTTNYRDAGDIISCRIYQLAV